MKALWFGEGVQLVGGLRARAWLNASLKQTLCDEAPALPQSTHLFCGRHVTTIGLAASAASPPGVWPPGPRGDAPGPVGVVAPLTSFLRAHVNIFCSA